MPSRGATRSPKRSSCSIGSPTGQRNTRWTPASAYRVEPLGALLRRSDEQPVAELVRVAAERRRHPPLESATSGLRVVLDAEPSSWRGRSGTSRGPCRAAGAARVAWPTPRRTPPGSCCRPRPATRRRAGPRAGARRPSPSSRPRSAVRPAAPASARGGCRGWSRTRPRTARRRGARAPGAPGWPPRTAASARPSRSPRPRSRADTSPVPLPTTRRPPDRRSIAASDFASARGPRTTASAIVVATVISPVEESTDARAVGPSSHGLRNCRWSFTDTALKPSRSAVPTYSSNDARSCRGSSHASSGRCTPRSTSPFSSRTGASRAVRASG